MKSFMLSFFFMLSVFFILSCVSEDEQAVGSGLAECYNYACTDGSCEEGFICDENDCCVEDPNWQPPKNDKEPVQGVDKEPVQGVDKDPVQGVDNDPVQGNDEEPNPGNDEEPNPGNDDSPVPDSNDSSAGENDEDVNQGGDVDSGTVINYTCGDGILENGER